MTDKDEKGFTRNAKTYFNTAYTADSKKKNDFPTDVSQISLMFAFTHTRRMPQSSKIDIRDRRQLLFVSYSSSLSLIYPSLLLEDTISAVK